MALDTPKHARGSIDRPDETHADESAAAQDYRRVRLAALGRVIRHISSLRAVVQLADSGPWVLYVTRSFPPEDHQVVTCDKVANTWGFYWTDGILLAPAQDVLGAARTVATAMTARRM